MAQSRPLVQDWASGSRSLARMGWRGTRAAVVLKREQDGSKIGELART